MGNREPLRNCQSLDWAQKTKKFESLGEFSTFLKTRHGCTVPAVPKDETLTRFLCFGGHFSKWIFAEGRPTRSPWCLEKIQGPIWRSKDHLVMKGLSKNVKNHEF